MSEKEVVEILKQNQGISITEVVNSSGLPRSRIRIILAKLEGAEKVRIRKVGMAKLYFFKKKEK